MTLAFWSCSSLRLMFKHQSAITLAAVNGAFCIINHAGCNREPCAQKEAWAGGRLHHKRQNQNPSPEQRIHVSWETQLRLHALLKRRSSSLFTSLYPSPSPRRPAQSLVAAARSFAGTGSRPFVARKLTLRGDAAPAIHPTTTWTNSPHIT